MNIRMPLTACLAFSLLSLLLAAAAPAQQNRPGEPSEPDKPNQPEKAPGTQPQTPAANEPAAAPPVDPNWLDRIPKIDRLLLDELIGYAPPPFTDDLTWVGTEALNWEALRGRVVVIQSWTTRKSGLVTRLQTVLERFAPEDVQILLLHTPEHADRAEKYLERKPMDHPVILDTTGAFSDALGVYKTPVNIVIDRQGVVRYAGLTWDGLEKAVEQLAAEPYDPQQPPPVREEEEESAEGFPKFQSDVGRARDLRGQRAPDLFVTQWVTGRPNAAGKVVVVDFWTVEEPRFYQHMAHLSQLSQQFHREVVIVGIAPDSSGKVQTLLRGAPVRYAIAIDQSTKPDLADRLEDDWVVTTRMKEAIGSDAWPYTLVMSADWVVRWRGHPMNLTAETLQLIVDANAKLREEARSPSRNRWTSGE